MDLEVQVDPRPEVRGPLRAPPKSSALKFKSTFPFHRHQHSKMEGQQQPSPFAYVFAFLLVAICWGGTVPFIRKAAISYTAPSSATHPSLDPKNPWLKRKLAFAFWTVASLFRKPGYAIPLVANLTGSIWFFLLVGKAELSLTVPIVNSLAFLFTVLGEWMAEGKVITRDTWIGMTCVCAGIGLCVASKL